MVQASHLTSTLTMGTSELTNDNPRGLVMPTKDLRHLVTLAKDLLLYNFHVYMHGRPTKEYEELANILRAMMQDSHPTSFPKDICATFKMGTTEFPNNNPRDFATPTKDLCDVVTPMRDQPRSFFRVYMHGYRTKEYEELVNVLHARMQASHQVRMVKITDRQSRSRIRRPPLRVKRPATPRAAPRRAASQCLCQSHQAELIPPQLSL